MSGHSKWKKIKRQKGAADLKKGNLFTKLGQAITLAVREGGGSDPDMNFMLRMAIDKAKEVNMPKNTIERAIDKGMGKSDNGPVEDISYDLTGKEGIAVIVDCLTDNKNRTVTEIRKVASDYGLNVSSGSINWQFEERGMIVVEALQGEEVVVRGKNEIQYKLLDTEELMLDLMELDGVEDVIDEDSKLIKIISGKKEFKKVYTKIKDKNIKTLSAEIVKRAKNYVSVSGKVKTKLLAMKEEVLENIDVISVWMNIK